MQLTLPVHSETSGNGKLAGSSSGEESARTRLLRRVLVIVLIVVVVTGFFAAAYSFHFLGLGTRNCSARPANVPASSTYSAVVMTTDGINVGFKRSKYASGTSPT